MVLALFDWLVGGRLVDLVSTRHHAPYLTRHRLGAIDTRIRLVAAAFSLLTLLWIALDAATLSADHWPFLAVCRTFAALVFIRLAIAPDRELGRARALTLLGILMAMPLMIYGLSQFLLADVPLQGLAAINGNLYRAIPLIALAGLSVFPLVAIEGLFFAVVIAAVVATIQRVLVGLDAIELFSTAWVFMLVMGVYLLGCAIQLNYMMTLARRASHDPLTGALTRRSGVEVLDLHFRLACAQDVALSVLFIGTDDFKSIDAKFGRGTGEQTLKEIAAKLHALLRLSDVVIRWCDEELVVILTNTPMRGARLVVDRFIDDWHDTRADGAPVTTSIGLAERQTDNMADWWQLVALSDKRMHAAKTTGKASCVSDEGVMQGKTQPAPVFSTA